MKSKSMTACGARSGSRRNGHPRCTALMLRIRLLLYLVGGFTLTRWIGNILRPPDTDGQADVPSQEFPIDENRLFHVKMVRLKVEVITP